MRSSSMAQGTLLNVMWQPGWEGSMGGRGGYMVCSQGYGFSSSHVWIRELDHKEGWVPKNWCFQIVVLEKTLDSPLDSKKIKPVNPKGNQSWIFIGRTDAETPTLWPVAAKNWLIGKDPDAGKDWRPEEKGTTDEMVGWLHRLDGHEFEQVPGVDDGQGSLTCCSLWGRNELDMTERLNWKLVGIFFESSLNQMCVLLFHKLVCFSRWKEMSIFSTLLKFNWLNLAFRLR